MKVIISIIFLVAAGCVTMFFTVPQYNCNMDTCKYDGIKASAVKNVDYMLALASAKDLESRRNELTDRYNSIPPEDKQRLEEMLPNNVDNIKLVLELETIAKKYGLLIENPKLNTKIETAKPTAGAPTESGQDLRANTSGTGGSALGSQNYGTFTLEFNVHATYENTKKLISDIEKNLRLIEITSIVIKVPPPDDGTNKNKKVYPPNTYDVSIKASIYYLKN